MRLVCLQVFGFYSKYREEHEKRFPSKGDALKERWNNFQTAQKAAAEAKKAKASDSSAAE